MRATHGQEAIAQHRGQLRGRTKATTIPLRAGRPRGRQTDLAGDPNATTQSAGSTLDSTASRVARRQPVRIIETRVRDADTLPIAAAATQRPLQFNGFYPECDRSRQTLVSGGTHTCVDTETGSLILGRGGS